MFAVPLFGMRRAPVKPPAWVKLCALSGLLMTALYVTLSVLPIIRRKPDGLRAEDHRADRRHEHRGRGAIHFGRGVCGPEHHFAFTRTPTRRFDRGLRRYASGSRFRTFG